MYLSSDSGHLEALTGHVFLNKFDLSIADGKDMLLEIKMLKH